MGEKNRKNSVSCIFWIGFIWWDFILIIVGNKKCYGMVNLFWNVVLSFCFYFFKNESYGLIMDVIFENLFIMSVLLDLKKREFSMVLIIMRFTICLV